LHQQVAIQLCPRSRKNHHSTSASTHT
jgi:hypothetical protein